MPHVQGHSTTLSGAGDYTQHAHTHSLSDTATLPNPYDGMYVGHDPFERSLPPTPSIGQPIVALSALPSRGVALNDAEGSSRIPHAPSAWRTSVLSASTYSDAPGSRVTSMLSASSSATQTEETALLGEMATYQKRLESHHRKESDDAVAAATASGVPEDPPPTYSPTDHGHLESGHSGIEQTQYAQRADDT